MFAIGDFLQAHQYTAEQSAYFAHFAIVEAFYHRSTDSLDITIENATILPYNLYTDLKEDLTKQTGKKVFLTFHTQNQDLPLIEINKYIKAFAANHNGAFLSVAASKDEEGLILSALDEDHYRDDQNFTEELKAYFKALGYDRKIAFTYRQIAQAPEERVTIASPAFKEAKVDDNPEKKTYKHYRKKQYTDVTIDDLSDTLYSVRFKGTIFKVDERKFNDRLRQTLYVNDDTNACIVKVNESPRFTKEAMAKNTVGAYAAFAGNYRFDAYVNDSIFEAEEIAFLTKEDPLKDDAETKRIELHCHTNRSEMDGICDAGEVIEAAFKMGHDAIAITDHLDVQSFPVAQRKLKELLKAHPERPFKVLFGAEVNMVDPQLKIVENVKQLSLDDAEYVIFDLETTGLSTRHDHVIEFGAVLFKGGQILERKDFFIKSPKELPQRVKELTNITPEDLKDALPFAEHSEEIRSFIKDRILVAHNASFDTGFLNEEFRRLKQEPLCNPIIDTLDLARALFKSRRSYRLGNIAKQYGVAYDEEVAHRADYDAAVLAEVFNLMLQDLREKKITDLEALSLFQSADAFIKKNPYHTNILCKNQAGLKDLFKLISISNTATLAIFGKANTKAMDSEYVAEPRVLRETLQAYRHNLLIGSGCFNGEVFDIASTRSKEELAKAIAFYDYIELQPLENYRPLVVDRGNFSWDELKVFQKDIIDEALKQGKIIVATGDVHYILKEQKIFRDVYVNSQAIGGTHHPLYLYNEQKRRQQIIPDQHLRNTEEMLEAFAWLNDQQLIKDLVINNPHKIADLCEVVNPVHDKLYTPTIEGSNESLTEIVWAKAHEIYGDELDEKIEKRIQRELDSIIGNGYGVIYYVSHLLVKKSNQDGYLVGSRGSVGSSLVATLAGITEVNPLPPHYVCPHCRHLEWQDDGSVMSGYNLPDKACPICGTMMHGDGQNIPFETFLGFDGDKVPDIDLNFSGDYQDKAHLFTREIFGEDHVFRAGTISTVAEKTAFGYVTGYCDEKGIKGMSKAQRQHLASGCEGVKRTTGQHPGGIIVIPGDMDVYDFTPIQYPANDPNSSWRTTHFDFHEIHDNVLKFDILGHVDPTAMRLLQEISGIDPKTIPMNDPQVMSLFSSSKALKIVEPDYDEATGACGLPEFGTRFVRGILQSAHPQNFSDLVQISGLSHGTDVWNNNAKDLVAQGIKLKDVIGCRDDIMSTMLSYGLPAKASFDIMEKVRKGKGLTPEYEAMMSEHNVPRWYIESCKKIKYMFPKAHATAYVIMAVRIAWFKVYYPEYYYVSFFSLRCDAYEIATMTKDAKTIKERMNEINIKMQSNDPALKATKKEIDIFNTLEVCYEMVCRGYRIANIDLERSLASTFLVNPEDHHEIIPPFTILDGLGDNVGESIAKARNERPFISKEDLLDRTLLSKTLLNKLEQLNVLDHLDESNQMSLF